jgi:hypothetical protein
MAIKPNTADIVAVVTFLSTSEQSASSSSRAYKAACQSNPPKRPSRVRPTQDLLDPC